MNKSLGFFVAASIAAAAPWLVAPAGAAPIASLSALQNAMPSSVEAVQYRQYRNRAYRGSGRVGPGTTGALIGGAPRGPTAKQAAGKVVGDAKLESEGQADKVEGKIQNAIGSLKDTLKGK